VRVVEAIAARLEVALATAATLLRSDGEPDRL
jgi:hypothetical protein